MGKDGVDYRVTLANGDSPVVTLIHARTPHLAVRAAEAQHNGLRAVSVSMKVIGKCRHCGSVLFDGECENSPTNLLKCQDC